MAVTVQQVLQILKEFAPPELACSWDNVGLLVDTGRPVGAIAVALDITADVVQEAAESSGRHYSLAFLWMGKEPLPTAQVARAMGEVLSRLGYAN